MQTLVRIFGASVGFALGFVVVLLIVAAILLAVADWDEVSRCTCSDLDRYCCERRTLACSPDSCYCYNEDTPGFCTDDNQDSQQSYESSDASAIIGAVLIVISLFFCCGMCICFCCDASYYGNHKNDEQKSDPMEGQQQHDDTEMAQ